VTAGARLAPEYTGYAVLQHTPITWRRLVAIARLPVEGAQCVHNVVERDQTLSPGWPPERRSRLYGAGVRSPGGKNRSLLVKRKIGIADHIAGMPECLRRMQKAVEVVIAALSWRPSIDRLRSCTSLSSANSDSRAIIRCQLNAEAAALAGPERKVAAAACVVSTADARAIRVSLR
jgi:hypothetical protein